MTWLLIAANVAMFVVELATGVDATNPRGDQLLPLGADFAPLTLHGEWWRLGASMFLHFGFMHIAGNMLGLAYGRIVEVLFGHIGFLAIYIVSGLIGGVVSLSHHLAISAGASGAVFGLFGAFAAFLLLRRESIEPAVWQPVARQLGGILVLNLVLGLTVSGIDMSAHVGGLVGGFVIAVLLLAGKTAARQHLARAVAILVIGSGLAFASLAVVPEPPAPPVVALLDKFDRVQHECLAIYNSKLEDTRAGRLDELGFADVIERDVLPKWHAMRLELDAFDTSGVKPSTQKRVDLARLYMKDREEAWKLLVQINRAPTEANKAQYHQLEEQTREVVRQIKALAPP